MLSCLMGWLIFPLIKMCIIHKGSEGMITNNRGMYVDGPIDGSEEMPDLLKRTLFSKKLASLIIPEVGEHCFTASLEAPWGYGKSSTINLLKKELEGLESPPIIIDFNPWLVNDSNSLIQKFLVQFAAQLNVKDRPKTVLKAAQELLAYSKLFDVVGLIPGAEPWASTIKKVTRGIGDASSKIAKLKQVDLAGVKQNVSDALAKLGKPIVVVIDDIDRLTPDEAFQMIKLSQAVADFEGTAFLLCFDYEYLVSSLVGNKIENPHQYLEKVVQLRVSLPLIGPEELHSMATDMLKGHDVDVLLERYPEDSSRMNDLYNHCIKHLLRSPRDIKRVSNHLKVVLAMIPDEVCISDLYALSVLATKAPNVYELIKSNPEYFIGLRFLDGVSLESPKDMVKNNVDSVLEVINTGNSIDAQLIRKLLDKLFPLFRENGPVMRSEEYDRLGQVAKKERLYTALHLRVPTMLISEGEINVLLHEGEGVYQNSISLFDSERIERFTDLIENHTDDFSRVPDNFVRILEAFLASSYGINSEYEIDPFGNVFSTLVRCMLKVIDKSEDRENLISSILEHKKIQPFSARLLSILLQQNGRSERSSGLFSQSSWVGSLNFDDLIESWVADACNEIDSHSVDSLPYVSYVFYLLHTLKHGAFVDLIGDWIDEERIVDLAYLMGRSRIDSHNGVYSEIKWELFEDIVNQGELVVLAEKHLENVDYDNVVKAFCMAVVNGEKVYHKDLSVRGEGDF
jgi:hypothetical protein